MTNSKSSGNLTKGDVISFVALLLMGIFVFFGANFMTLGDRIVSIVIAVLTVVLMTVFVFLAAYAKEQDYNQSVWRKIEYTLVGLYVLALIPCYLFNSKFFDIELDKGNIMKMVQEDNDDLDRLFVDYNHQCEARINAYQIELEYMLITPEGRKRLASILEVDNPSSINKESVNQAVRSFSKRLKGSEFNAIEEEKKLIVSNSQANFNNWDLMALPQYAQQLGNAKNKYGAELERIYSKTQNSIEKNVPEFKVPADVEESKVLHLFTSTWDFSWAGLGVTVILGFLGLVKYLMGKKSSVVQMKRGDASVIEAEGGIQIKPSNIK